MRNLYTILFLSSLLFSCNSIQKKEERKVNPTTNPPIQLEEKKELILKQDSLDTSITIKEEIVELLAPNVLMRMEKKPCSGDCPQFIVEITKDSVFSFTGVNYVAKEGLHELKLNNEQFSAIHKALNSTSFESYNASYFTDETKDYSETSFIYNNKQVGVKLWKDAPEALADLYVVIEDFLYTQKFLEE